MELAVGLTAVGLTVGLMAVGLMAVGLAAARTLPLPGPLPALLSALLLPQLGLLIDTDLLGV